MVALLVFVLVCALAGSVCLFVLMFFFVFVSVLVLVCAFVFVDVFLLCCLFFFWLLFVGIVLFSASLLALFFVLLLVLPQVWLSVGFVFCRDYCFVV